MTVTTVKLATLIEDFGNYPRDNVDTHHISRIAEALRAGQDFQPLIAEKKSRRLVDGLHRRRARFLVYGEDAEGAVEWRTYPDDDALFLDAAELNTHHGLKMSRLDEAHCMQLAIERGIPAEQMAKVLGLTHRKYEELRGQRFATSPDGAPILLKRSNKHLAGRNLTAGQVDGNSRASGWTLGFHVDQVINALQSGIADSTDTAIVARLHDLMQVVNSFLGEPPDAAEAAV